jgi:2,3-bisphosphoglycerate-independent phosphoglycerate mutase
MDGVGINEDGVGDAVKAAKTPNLDFLFDQFAHSSLEASGKSVGLPEGQMGNSEVGHLNIGAGRVVYTGLSIINNAIETNKFTSNPSFNEAIKHCQKNKSKLHIMGLVSKGGVHSSFEHLLALINTFKGKNVDVILHIFADGRDVAPKSLLNDLNELKPVLEKNNVKIGSISGRYYSMDRDKNWDRVLLFYDVLLGKTNSFFTDPFSFIQENYDKNITDEFIVPSLNQSYPNSEICLSDNDSVIFFNYRPDRARELSHLIFNSSLYDFECERKKNLYFVTMMKYEGIVPSSIAFLPEKIINSLGSVISKNNLNQLRIAETEKYAHVTFFFDGGEEIDYPKETKIIIDSPKTPSYASIPEMSADKVCEQLINNMTKNDVIICNFANGDMVGHTGDFHSTIKAVEKVDECVGMIYKEALKNNYTLFITADHGNAEVMFNDKNEIITSHSTNKVPLIICDKNIKKISDGKLADIAPSILKYLNIEIPKEMTGHVLF